MKIFVTGGAGFIGSTLIKQLLTDGNDIVTIDNFENYYEPKLKRENIIRVKDKRLKVYEGDINNIKLLSNILAKGKFNKIVHLAAKVGVRNSIDFAEDYIKTNVDGTHSILNLAARNEIKDIVFTSSSSVYGKNSGLPSNEEESCNKPLNPYAFSKRAAELLCYTFHKLYGLNITILRLFSVYGPFGRPDMSPYLFTQSIFQNKPIKIFGDGKASRDFTFIDDIVKGINSAIHKPFPFEIINLGGSHPITVIKIIRILEELIGRKAIIKYSEPINSESYYTYADINKAKRLINFKVGTDIYSGLEKTVRWYRKYRRSA